MKYSTLSTSTRTYRIHVKIGTTKEKKALDQYYYNSTSTTQSFRLLLYTSALRRLAGWRPPVLVSVGKKNVQFE